MSSEAFEAWWEKEGQFCRAGGGDYEKTFAFRAWQAARAAALEEAASAAFNHFVDVCRERKVDQDFVRVWCSSDAIRALKDYSNG